MPGTEVIQTPRTAGTGTPSTPETGTPATPRLLGGAGFNDPNVPVNLTGNTDTEIPVFRSFTTGPDSRVASPELFLRPGAYAQTPFQANFGEMEPDNGNDAPTWANLGQRPTQAPAVEGHQGPTAAPTPDATQPASPTSETAPAARGLQEPTTASTPDGAQPVSTTPQTIPGAEGPQGPTGAPGPEGAQPTSAAPQPVPAGQRSAGPTGGPASNRQRFVLETPDLVPGAQRPQTPVHGPASPDTPPQVGRPVPVNLPPGALVPDFDPAASRVYMANVDNPNTPQGGWFFQQQPNRELNDMFYARGIPRGGSGNIGQILRGTDEALRQSNHDARALEARLALQQAEILRLDLPEAKQLAALPADSPDAAVQAERRRLVDAIDRTCGRTSVAILRQSSIAGTVTEKDANELLTSTSALARTSRVASLHEQNLGWAQQHEKTILAGAKKQGLDTAATEGLTDQRQRSEALLVLNQQGWVLEHAGEILATAKGRGLPDPRSAEIRAMGDPQARAAALLTQYDLNRKAAALGRP
jgi:hypothetical protein